MTSPPELAICIIAGVDGVKLVALTSQPPYLLLTFSLEHEKDLGMDCERGKLLVQEGTGLGWWGKK